MAFSAGIRWRVSPVLHAGIHDVASGTRDLGQQHDVWNVAAMTNTGFVALPILHAIYGQPPFCRRHRNRVRGRSDVPG